MSFELFGVKFKVGFLVVAVMSCVLVCDTSFKVCACMISAFIHEMGHLTAMTLFRIKPESITLNFFDINISADTDKNFFSDMIITLSGPVINFIFAFIFYGVSTDLFVSNLVIGIFNLLPVETFDGGHALFLLLSKKFNLKASETIVRILTFVFLVPFLFFGISMLFYSKYNYSLLLISLYLVAILFTK